MGQTLSEPVTTKDSACCSNASFRVGSSCMQGWRVEMEDAHTHILSLPDEPQASFFAVYDGHGGASVAKFAGKNMHKFVTQRPEYREDTAMALKKAFLDFDREILMNGTWNDQVAGSTAVVVLIRERRLYCANAGDSRAIACISGSVQALSVDHKPTDEAETRRILAGGGWVEFNRVNGNLALSRALGDFMYKKNSHKRAEDQIVTADPDVQVRDITEDWEFVVLACDGIWDVMSNAEVCQFVRSRIAAGVLPPERICEELMSACLASDVQLSGLGGDNMTVILVCFLHNKSYEDLVVRCGGARKPPMESAGDIKDHPTSMRLASTSASASRLGMTALSILDGDSQRKNA
ncbi:uncharacterized protein Dana_GF24758, isoform B [Drosophila ananassae]|nr:probable protein phosphatase 2C T23F11.1 [Drosophila ananassae]KPU77732.1 uncharacterized protein Dana_GF24758, isoform B [Drosophila ananassae]